MTNDTPSSIGTRRCLEWIRACEAMGWPKSAIPRLVDIFWEFKDRDGNLKGERSAPSETFASLVCSACNSDRAREIGCNGGRIDCPIKGTAQNRGA